MSRKKAQRRRDALEVKLAEALRLVMDDFLEGVRDDAYAALEAPAVLAAAVKKPRPDPFAYTNIITRWRAAIASLVEVRKDFDSIRSMLESSTLPDVVFADVTDILQQTDKSVLALKRQLSKLLIPKQGTQDKDEYRRKLIGLARMAATRSFNSTELQALAEQGYASKRWVSMHDDRVRHSHVEADGQVQPVDQPFLVGGDLLMYPGDPTATIDETANCRCVIVGYGARTLDPTPALTAASEGDTMNRTYWEGCIGVEGLLTGDGRLIENDALRWENLPIPFRHVAQDVGAHDGAVVVGAITEIVRAESGEINASGWMDGDSDAGREAVRMVREGLLDGVSMDLDDVSFEIRVASEVIEKMTEPPEVTDEGEPIIAFPDPDEDGRVTVATISTDDEIMVTTSARVRAATLVAIPAFVEARIALTDEVDEVDEDEDAVETELVAAGGPVAPPLRWFDNPLFDEVTPIRVTDEGRIYGHLATWDTCHVGFDDTCVSPPTSTTNYGYFHVGSLVTREGNEIAVGRITLDTGHAGPKLDAVRALAHYDNTGTVVADVRVGEDRHGIWVSGAARPGLPDTTLRSLRSCPLSGDWRRVQGNLELVAALCVPVPGFPIPRPSGLVAGGHVQSLVASGLVPPKGEKEPDGISDDDMKWLKKLASRERTQAARLRAKVLAQRVKLAVR